MQNSDFLPALSLLPKNTKDKGECLTLSKFILVIYLCSVFGYQDPSNINSSSSEKLLILLERIELSRTDLININNSLLPPGDVIQIIIDHEPNEGSIYDVEEDAMSSISLDQEGAMIADKYLSRLQSIFQVYCAYGDPLNIKKMKSSNLLKLLKNADILGDPRPSSSFDNSVGIKNREMITAVEVDLIFSRLTGVKKQMSKTKKITASIEFQQFLKTLELVSRKIFPEMSLQEGFNKLLEENILRLESQLCEERATNSKAIQENMEEFKNDDVIEALSLVKRSVLYYYKAYAGISMQMNFQGFIKFCKDFEIFPDITSKTKLLRIFKTLAEISSADNLEASVQSFSSLDENIPMSEDHIDENLFVEALALISADINYEDPFPGPIAKICWFIERLSQSSGPEKVVKALGHNRTTSGEGPDMIALLKARYPDILDHSEHKKPTFQDLAFLVSLSD